MIDLDHAKAILAEHVVGAALRQPKTCAHNVPMDAVRCYACSLMMAVESLEYHTREILSAEMRVKKLVDVLDNA